MYVSANLQSFLWSKSVLCGTDTSFSFIWTAVVPSSTHYWEKLFPSCKLQFSQTREEQLTAETSVCFCWWIIYTAKKQISHRQCVNVFIITRQTAHKITTHVIFWGMTEIYHAKKPLISVKIRLWLRVLARADASFRCSPQMWWEQRQEASVSLRLS